MAKDWNGQTYNEDWVPIDAMGNPLGGKDWSANASWAASTGGQNPYTNQAGSSPWDKSGLTPGNEPGSTLAPVGGSSSTGTQGLSGPVWDKLMSELNLSDTVDQNDPAYKQQIDANAYSNDRNAARQRAATAQRMAATGTASGGALDSAVQRITGDQGVQDQQFQANLLNSFHQQRLDRVAQALNLGTGLLSQQQELAMRKMLTESGYDLQRYLGNADLNFRRDALGQQGAFNQAQLDQQAMLALLNG